MTKILVPSASHILTDHYLSSEGTFCYTLFKNLEKYGYQFEAISAYVKVNKPLKNTVFHQAGSEAITPTMDPIRKYSTRIKFMLQAYRKSLKIIEKHKIDIIHHMLPAVYNQTFSPLAIMGKTRKHPFIFGPLSAHIHPRPLDEKILLPITSKLHKKTVQKSDAIITITEYVKNLYSKFLNEEKIRVIPLGIDTEKFKPAKNPHKEENHYEILFTGYLYKIKGVEHLIKAIKIVLEKEKKKNIRLRIVGEGPEKPHLEKLAEALKIKNKVIFEGFIPYTKIHKYYQKCDIFCFPTLGEPFGKAIVEAMACAKPVIASNIGGPKEIIDNGVNGLLVPPANPEKIAEKIINLLEDKHLRKKIGENARKKAIEKYSWRKISQEYHKLYKSLI